MRPALLAELIAGSRARRGAILVTDVASGAQRLVWEAEIAGDPLAPQLAAQMRLGTSALIATPEGARLFLRGKGPNCG